MSTDDILPLQTRKALARKAYPLYKEAMLRAQLADAGAELRDILYLIITCYPGRVYRSLTAKRTIDVLNHWSAHYKQGKVFYVGQVAGVRGMKVRVIHPPEININCRRDLSTVRYNPKSYGHQVVD